MQCPVDGTTLQMSERAGIEIDYCPQCRGVWLDRGELDKIIAKQVEQDTPAAPQAPPPPQQPQGGPWSQPGYPSQGYDPRYGHKPYKRKKSFIEQIFD